MVVDDETPNIRIAKRCLTKLGVAAANLESCTDGQQLVNHFAKCTAADRPGIVLLDLLMPRMSGLEAMEALIAAGGTGCPVVAVTGNVTADTKVACRNSDFAGMLCKPYTRAKLRLAMSRALENAASGDPNFFVL